MVRQNRYETGGARRSCEDGHRPAFEASGASPPVPRQVQPVRGRSTTIGALPRMAVSPREAAEMIGVGRSFLYEHILPELRTVRCGKKRLIPVAEIDRYLDRNAARVLG